MTRRTAWFAAFTHPTPSRLEDWLESEAKRGWQPHELDDLSSIRLHLEATKPASVRYVVDTQQRADDSYRATYEDAGWTHVGVLSSLQVWRRRYTGARPEAFTDLASGRARDVRLAWATGIVGSLALLAALTRIVLGVAKIGASAQDWPLEAGILAAVGVPLVVLTVVLVRRRPPHSADSRH